MSTGVVDAGRFKTLPVKQRISIQDFVKRNKLEFKPGRGFYKLLKPETIQVYKEVVARRKADGTFVSGDAVRKILGIPTDPKAKFRMSADTLADFDIFVQSTSFNRVLTAGSEFLYDTEGEGISRSEIASARATAKRRLEDAGDDDDFIPVGGAKKKKYKGPIKLNTTAAPPPPAGGAGSPIEIVFCFDTTGSMASCLGEVRKRVREVVQRLLKDIPTIRIALFACGDYCDAHSSYVTEFMDFSSDMTKLCNWVINVGSSGGGDFEECYELAFHQIRTCMSWTAGTQRSVVMIGDAIPHGPTDGANETGLDWRQELQLLTHDWGVRMYSVQCQQGSLYGDLRTKADKFWKTLASKSGGVLLNLDSFDSVVDLILAICYREQGIEQLQAYEAEVTKREMKRTGSGMNKALNDLFAALRSADSIAGGPSTSAAAPALSAADILTGTAGAGGKKKKTAGAAKKAAAAKKPAAKKAAAKKTAAKKPAAKKPAAKKAAAKKPAVKKPAAKKPAAKKTAAKKTAAKKPAAKKGGGKKPAAAKKAAAKGKAKPVAKGKAKASPRGGRGKGGKK